MEQHSPRALLQVLSLSLEVASVLFAGSADFCWASAANNLCCCPHLKYIYQHSLDSQQYLSIKQAKKPWC
jgi:hypothetical protein